MKRLHPLVGIVRALQYAAYGVGLPLFGVSVVSAAVGGVRDAVPLAAVMGVGFLAGVAYGTASYVRYTYRITDDTFDVFSGVFARREREIPHSRIQNVDVSRNVWQNLFGLATVRVETAGGGSTEAVLAFVSIGEAERLQRTLRERRTAVRSDEERPDGSATREGVEPSGDAEPVSTGDPDTRTLFALSDAELAAHAATTFRPGVLAVLVIGTPLLEEFVADLLLALAAPIGGPDRLAAAALTPDEVLALAVVGVPVGIASAWTIGIAIGVNQYYGFRLVERGEELAYERGLLSEFSGTIPLGKVQTLTVTENALQRALGYAGLSINTAGHAAGGGGGGNRSAIPLADRERVAALVDMIEGADLHATVTRPPARARERYAVRYGVALGAVLGVAFAASRVLPGFSLWWTPGLFAPAIPVLAHLKWKHRGYALCEDHLLVRSGFFRRRTQIVPYHRLQTITRARTVFQRRRRLAHLIADTASGGVLNRIHPVAYDHSDEEMRELQERLRERLQGSLKEPRKSGAN